MTRLPRGGTLASGEKKAVVMHELSLCEAIVDIAHEQAAGRSVEAVHLRVGQLRQVVPEALTFCWEMVTTDTELAGSALQIDPVDALVRCRGCRHEFGLGPILTMACEKCLSTDVEVLAGEELLVTALELEAA